MTTSHRRLRQDLVRNMHEIMRTTGLELVNNNVIIKPYISHVPPTYLLITTPGLRCLLRDCASRGTRDGEGARVRVIHPAYITRTASHSPFRGALSCQSYQRQNCSSSGNRMHARPITVATGSTRFCAPLNICLMPLPVRSMYAVSRDTAAIVCRCSLPST